MDKINTVHLIGKYCVSMEIFNDNEYGQFSINVADWAWNRFGESIPGSIYDIM